MRNSRAFLAAALLLGALPVFAAGDGPAGKAEVCQARHGADGISRTPGVPSLAGQPNQFLQWQLVFFRSGRRQNEEYLAKALADYRSGARPSTGVAAMTEAASALSDTDIMAIAHYLAKLP